MNDINFTMYKLAGIIAEYDPFHNGHAWQLQQAKALGAQRVAVAMSCGLTQRGALPLLPESVRVQAALTCGADLVFALPAPYACSGAECFARAGVQLLAAAGCDALVFGAETPDAALLMEAARVLSGADTAPPSRPGLLPGPAALRQHGRQRWNRLSRRRPWPPSSTSPTTIWPWNTARLFWSWGLLWCRSPCPGRVPVTGRP